MTFKLCNELVLPARAATDTYACLGTRGSGKSYAAGKMVETFHDGGVQVVVIDPAGVWYGLRLAADGRGRGLDIPVFGGWHGDIPLEPTAGELVAKLVAERGLSVVLDVSEFTGGQQHKFVTAFSRALFDLKKRNRSPVHVVLEEAHEFLPQQVGPGEAEMVGAVKRLWKIGRNFGIGGTLITQRAAEINKGALNLTEVMFCGKLKGPQDRKAIEGWARDQDADGVGLAELPTLPSGTLLVWRDGKCIKVRVDRKRTFDASKTPERGDAAPAQALPRIDLDLVREQMAATLEDAKEHDPKILRDRIALLQREIVAKATPATATITVPTFPREMLDATIDAWKNAEQLAARVRDLATEVGELVEKGRKLEANGSHAGATARIGTVRAVPVKTLPPWRERIEHDSAALARNGAASNGSSGNDGAARMLRALAARHPTPLTRSQLATLTGIKPNGSTFRTYVGHLLSRRHIIRDGEFFRLTDEGLATAGPVETVSSPRELVAMWKDKLTGKGRDILEMLATSDVPLSKAQLAGMIGIDAAGSTFRTYFGHLSANGLVERAPGGFRVVESLRLA